MVFANSFFMAARIASRSRAASSVPCVLLNPVRSFSSKDWSVYYKIEANNAVRIGATQLTVSGPDIDGILANMTVALAMKGCSLVELHAGNKSVDTATHHHVYEHEERPMIYDVFYVVDRRTGSPFDDEDLEPLAKSLLESLKTPMNLVGLGGTSAFQDDLPEPTALSLGEEQITIVKSTDKL
jgi:hypothetical protein